jgi:general secretion pathway protein F
MPLFVYTGQNSQTGKKVKSVIEAESLKDAKVRLRRQNVYVLDIKQDDKAVSAEHGGGTLMQRLSRKAPTPEDVAMSTKQLSILVKAAVDISESLRSISDQVENDELKSIYVKIRELVSEGKSLSYAHAQFPKVFSPIYTNMLAAAEKSGALPLVLRRLSDFMSYQLAIKRKVVGALTYPAIMIVVAIGVTIFLFVNVLPKITKAFSSLKVTLPWYSIMLNNISAWLQSNWIICLVLVFVAILGLQAWIRTPKGRYKWDKFLYTGPVVGPLIQRVCVSRFTKTLSTVLSSGVRIVEGLSLTRNVIGNKYLEEAIDQAIQSVQDGDKLAASLERSGRVPVMVTHMLKTGEKTGRLEEMLQNIAEAYDDEVDHKISSTTKLIEPVMMIFMAGLVFLIVMSVLGPMMQAMNSLK